MSWTPKPALIIHLHNSYLIQMMSILTRFVCHWGPDVNYHHIYEHTEVNWGINVQMFMHKNRWWFLVVVKGLAVDASEMLSFVHMFKTTCFSLDYVALTRERSEKQCVGLGMGLCLRFYSPEGQNQNTNYHRFEDLPITTHRWAAAGQNKMLGLAARMVREMRSSRPVGWWLNWFRMV